jgi:DNA-directed RNA polymerase alpha subunit
VKNCTAPLAIEDILGALRRLRKAVDAAMLEIEAIKTDDGARWRRRLVGDVELSPRALAVCGRRGIMTLGDIDALDDRDILRMPNAGRRTLTELREIVECYRQPNAGARS